MIFGMPFALNGWMDGRRTVGQLGGDRGRHGQLMIIIKIFFLFFLLGSLNLQFFRSECSFVLLSKKGQKWTSRTIFIYSC